MNDSQRPDTQCPADTIGPSGWVADEAVGEMRTKCPQSSRDASGSGGSRPRSITEAFRVLKAVRESVGPCADETQYPELDEGEPAERTGLFRKRRPRSHVDSLSQATRALLFWGACALAGVLAPAVAAQNNAPEQRAFEPGDAVRISVLADSTAFLEGLYHIDDSGDIFLPIVGRTQVTNLTVTELKTYLDSVYLRYLRYPDVRVQRMVRLSFLGGFHQPGLYYVDPHQSLWDALAQAGGPMREDGLCKLRWQRADYVVDKDLVPELKAGHSLAELGVESGDLIWVTDNPKRNGWEVFRDDVMPLLSLTISIATAGLALWAVIDDDD